MSAAWAQLAYLGSAAMFIWGLKGLSSPRTARWGNAAASGGMLAAVVVTLIDQDIVDWGVVAAGLAVGAVVGAVAAVRVQMTEMPQLVAAFNGFGGIASALVAAAEFFRSGDTGAFANETVITIAASILIGGVTFSGSFVAFAKLQGLISGRPLTYPGQRVVNGLMAAGAVAAAVWLAVERTDAPLWLAGALALAIGVAGVLPIGGADMPVVISLLNSLSGVAAAMAGFVINNTALIIGGALVGAAGMILTLLMTEAMNRPLSNVLFGAFGGGGTAAEVGARSARSTTAADVAISLAYANTVTVIPGYGLAVAQAQHSVAKLAAMLEERGVSVGYAIHPVAGRMPGHMNVLLAEADVAYEQLLDLEEANDRLTQSDVVLVVGANDVVNPSARDDSASPIYGMPILEADKATSTVVIKRSLSPGFAGIDNPLFYLDNTAMLFADAKAALDDVAKALADV